MIPKIIGSIQQGKEIPIYGNGKNVRDWLYVEDHVRGLYMIQECRKLYETYNLGGNNEKSNLEMIESVIRTLQDLGVDLTGKVKITYVKDRLGHDRRYALSSEKVQRDIGWKPEICFEEGMKKTVEWYKEKSV